jgi:hypothetical protein
MIDCARSIDRSGDAASGGADVVRLLLNELIEYSGIASRRMHRYICVPFLVCNRFDTVCF